MKSKNPSSIQWLDILWDVFCVVSVVGIWPRFIEPNLLCTTSLTLKIPKLPKDLEGFKILQLSDIHLQSSMSDRFLKKIIDRTKKIQPDVIVLTGDFLCYSKCNDKERLKNWLGSFSAPYGCYAIFGNHDYSEPVSINKNGEYDVTQNQSSLIKRGFDRIFSTIVPTTKVTDRAKKIQVNQELVDLLAQTPFELLDNRSKQLNVHGSILNICGLGEYTIGRCLPASAFQNYDNTSPGIILAHNPDSISLLKDYPGNIILSGHTHGGQINLPWLWKKLTLLEHIQLKKGLVSLYNKLIYVSRGLGSVMPFRWFSPPEIVLIQLEKSV